MKRVLLIVIIAVSIILMAGCPGETPSGTGEKGPERGGSTAETAADAESAAFDGAPSGESLQPGAMTAAMASEPEHSILPAYSEDTHAELFSFRDDFDDLDPDFWTAIEEKTNREVNQKLFIDDGSLVIEAAETDRNPFVHSKALPLPDNGIVTVRRRVKIHNANEYFNGTFSIYQSSREGIKIPEDDTGREETEGIVGVQFLNFQYDPGRFPITDGVLVSAPDYRNSGEYAVIEEAPFDRWVEEEIEYHSGTGEIVYRLDGESRIITGNPAILPYFRIYMNAYGWHTGHRADVDYIEVSVRGAGGGYYEGDGLPPGVPVTKPVIEEKYIPDIGERSYTAFDEVTVTLPGAASAGERQLTVRPLAVEVSDTGSFGSSGLPVLSAYDISLEGVHRFDGLVRVDMPLPDLSGISGDRPEDRVIAVSYDPAAAVWRQEPAEFTGEVITVLVNHLSTVGIRERGDAPSSAVTGAYETVPTGGKQEALDAAWSSFLENLGITSAAGTFTALVTELPFIGEINDALGTFGNAMAVLDTADKMVDGKTAEANLAALKSVTGWLTGKLAATGMQLASLGVFFIDYSLTKFAATALEREWAAYESAYNEYYRKHGKSTVDWYNDVKAVMASAGSGEEASRRLNEMIDSYVNLLWEARDSGADAYNEFEVLVNKAKGTERGQASLSLNADVRRKLSENHKAMLVGSLQPVFLTVKKNLLSGVSMSMWRNQWSMEDFLKRKALVFVDIDGLREGERAEAALFQNGKIMLKGRSAANTSAPEGTDYYIALPVRRLVETGGPDALKIRVHLRDGEETVTKVFSKAFTMKERVSTVFFDLDDVYDRSEAGGEGATDADTAADEDTADGGSGADSHGAGGPADVTWEGVWEGQRVIRNVDLAVESKIVNYLTERDGVTWEAEASEYIGKEDSLGLSITRNDSGELVLYMKDKNEYDLHVDGRKFSFSDWLEGKNSGPGLAFHYNGRVEDDGKTITGDFYGDSKFGVFAEGDFVLRWERGFDESEYETSEDDLMF